MQSSYYGCLATEIQSMIKIIVLTKSCNLLEKKVNVKVNAKNRASKEEFKRLISNHESK